VEKLAHELIREHPREGFADELAKRGLAILLSR
jgi:hypothetical protein